MQHEKVENELHELVDVLIAQIPSLKEVRVFGSYNNGNWNPEKSDIDVFILLDDEYFDSYRDTEMTDIYTIIESRQRRELRKNIEDKLAGEYTNRMTLSLCTPLDVKRLEKVNEGRGYLGINMKKGRLLYSRDQETYPATKS